jgi:leucyl aminopeptidase
MKIIAKRQSLLTASADLLVFPACEIAKKSGSKNTKNSPWAAFEPSAAKKLKELDQKHDGALFAALSRSKFSVGKAKRVSAALAIGSAAKQLRLSGLSPEAFDEKDPALEEWRRLGADALKAAESAKLKALAIDLSSAPSKALHSICAAIVEGAELAEYQFTKYKSSKSSKTSTVKSLTLLLASAPSVRVTEAIEQAQSRTLGTILTRDLVNTPAGDMTPRDFVREAKKVCQKRGTRLKLQLHSEAQLKKMGANSLLSVSHGSDQPPYLLHITYSPRTKVKDSKKVVLVGKGVTFDSGGLSIKPWDGMTTMKCDMAGAASVLGTMSVLAKLEIKHEVHGIIPLVENMINGQATRPGDIVKAINGKTIEILNTDAEGRLILADALCYSKRCKADVTIDLATLTGACVVALGMDIAASYTDDKKLSDALIRSGKQSGDKLWPMPLEAEYRKMLNSPVADLKNIGGRVAGSITAALFLKEFVPEGVRWAHLDIAGPAFGEKATDYKRTGASGFGVRLLLDFLSSPF